MDTPAPLVFAPGQRALEAPADGLRLKIMPGLDSHANMRSAAVRGLPMVRSGTNAGERIVIVAPGPSLTERDPSSGTTWLARAGRLADRGFKVLGIKGAIRLLRQRGIRVDFSCNMDPGPAEAEKTPRHDGIRYFLATSCHPALFDHLAGADVVVYHSACGAAEWGIDPRTRQRGMVRDETSYTRRLFGPAFDGFAATGGYTVANRAVSLAEHLGFAEIVVIGADFGWRRGATEFYAKGVDAKLINDPSKQWLDDEGRIEGRGGHPWCTQPDMLGSAVSMAKLIKAGRVKVMGDSMAIALSRREDEFIAQLGGGTV